MYVPKTQIILVTNRKGGVGKTSIAVNVSAALAAMGKRVLLVDADSQGQCALLLNMPEENGLFQMVIQGAAFADVIRPIAPERYQTDESPGELFLLPGAGMTYSIMDYDSARKNGMVMYNRLWEIAEVYDLDFILVDTQPSITLFDAALWLAADHFLYVTTLDRLSVAGLQSGIDQLVAFNPNRRNHGLPPTQVLGIIPNRVERDTLVNQTVGEQLSSAYQAFVWPPVLERKTWQRAAQLQKIVYKYSPRGQAAQDCWAIARRMMEVLHVSKS